MGVFPYMLGCWPLACLQDTGIFTRIACRIMAYLLDIVDLTGKTQVQSFCRQKLSFCRQSCSRFLYSPWWVWCNVSAFWLSDWLAIFCLSIPLLSLSAAHYSMAAISPSYTVENLPRLNACRVPMSGLTNLHPV